MILKLLTKVPHNFNRFIKSYGAFANIECELAHFPESTQRQSWTL